MPASRRRFLWWGFGLAALHVAASLALTAGGEWAFGLLYESGIPSLLMDDRVDVVLEITIAGVTFLHLPSFLLAGWQPFPGGALVGLLVWYVLEPMLYGFGVATVARWLRRPPGFVSKLRCPGMTRRTLGGALVLAPVHFALSALLYFSLRWREATGGTPRDLSEGYTVLKLLHPWLTIDRGRIASADDPAVIAFTIGSSLLWGSLAAWGVTLLHRVFVHDRQARS